MSKETAIEDDWGKDLKGLSIDNWDFLKHKSFTNRIAMRGSLDMGRVNCVFKEMLARYQTTPILEETSQYISFNSVMCLDQVSRLFEGLGVFAAGGIKSVVEVGAGLGNFSRVLRQFAPILAYNIYDLAVMRRFSEKFLTANNLMQRDVQLGMGKYDLFVSNICLSEIEHSQRSRIVGDLLPRCEYAFIIDGDDGKEGFNEWLSAVVTKHFNEVHIIPYPTGPWRGQRIYIGKDKKDV